MTNNEVNIVISEYMGARVEHVNSWCEGEFSRIITEGGSYQKLYTNSLDALVPVWERLGRYAACGKQEEQGFQAIMLPTTISNMASVYSMPTIQEAAAHATAICIKELSNEK